MQHHPVNTQISHLLVHPQPVMAKQIPGGLVSYSNDPATPLYQKISALNQESSVQSCSSTLQLSTMPETFSRKIPSQNLQVLPALTAIQGGVRLGLPHPKPEQATIFHQQHLATGLAKDPATTTDFGAARQKYL